MSERATRSEEADPRERGATSGRAPGKAILAGEHAVVYGHPAASLPLHNLNALATVVPASPGYGTVIASLEMQMHVRLRNGGGRLAPLARAVAMAMKRADLSVEPDWILQVRSELPAARGLGSGAAVSCAAVRAVLQAAGISVDREEENRIVHVSEQLLHGRPSGIDSSTVVHGRPLLFKCGRPPRFFEVADGPEFLLADTGIASLTSEAVGRVAASLSREPDRAKAVMTQIGEISEPLVEALTEGNLGKAGELINSNQGLLRQLGVSEPANEKLIQAALEAGAPAAKVTGGGLGGHILVLTDEIQAPHVEESLKGAGAEAVRRLLWRRPDSDF